MVNRWVILGATGFVGSALLRRITQLPPESFEVRVLVRRDDIRWEPHPGVQTFKGDLAHIPSELFFKEPHGVLHFATQQRDLEGVGFEQVNVQGTEALLKSLPSSTRWLIYGSSASVYGQSAQNHSVETTPLSPETPLAHSRQRAEEKILHAMSTSQRSAAVLRPRFILGPGDRFTLPGFLKLYQLRIGIHTGKQKYSMIEVSDYAEMILRIARYLTLLSETGQSFCSGVNIGYSQGLSYNELFQTAQEYLGSPEPFLKIPISEAFLGKLRASCPWLRNTIPLLEKYLTQLELVGLDHFLSVQTLETMIGTEITSKNPLEIIRSLITQESNSLCLDSYSH